MMKCKICGKQITAERRKSYCSQECYLKSKVEERKKRKKEVEKPKAVLKDKSVCKGCKYLNTAQGNLHGTCNYSENGKSRVLIERANGGVQKDSCCCYERK